MMGLPLVGGCGAGGSRELGCGAGGSRELGCGAGDSRELGCGWEPHPTAMTRVARAAPVMRKCSGRNCSMTAMVVGRCSSGPWW